MAGGEAGAPQRRGLANGVPDGSTDPVGGGGRAAAARAARSVAEGQHEWGEGRARRGGGLMKGGTAEKEGSAAIKKSPQAFTRGDILQIT